MVTITSLWLPILLSGVLVFIVSSVIHMVLRYHNSDFAGVPNEAQLLEALRPLEIPPGDYMFPHATDLKEAGSPEFVEKCVRGPVATMTVMPSGPPSMTGSLVLWFLYSLIIGVFAAYITGRAFPAGAEYMDVFRFSGTTAFLCYAVGGWQNSIWYKRKWSTTLKNTIDGLIYGLATAGVFAWLWPEM